VRVGLKTITPKRSVTQPRWRSSKKATAGCTERKCGLYFTANYPENESGEGGMSNSGCWGLLEFVTYPADDSRFARKSKT
jgi:hypothetical protein